MGRSRTGHAAFPCISFSVTFASGYILGIVPDRFADFASVSSEIREQGKEHRSWDLLGLGSFYACNTQGHKLVHAPDLGSCSSQRVNPVGQEPAWMNNSCPMIQMPRGSTGGNHYLRLFVTLPTYLP
ncbi:hypothetical protein C8J56DRAFT_276872 [Mycena floridula]|nr:hypothetical protein C8J56DRAFT_276872 [Mycena floridula]